MDSKKINKRIIIFGVTLALVVVCVVLFAAGHKHNPTPQRKTEAQDSYPLNTWLPWQTPHYKISFHYNQATKRYDYLITLYAIINQPSQYDSYIAQLKQYKQEALDYIRSKGADPAKLNISYLPQVAVNL